MIPKPSLTANLFFTLALCPLSAEPVSRDIVVYGGTGAGIVAGVRERRWADPLS